MHNKNIVQEKSFAFALQVIELYKTMHASQEYVISKQLLKCGTSIGANIHEAGAAQTKKDFITKMAIASKEARETQYWLRLLQQSQLLPLDTQPLIDSSNDLINLLTAIVKTAQNNSGR
ncbi:MAG: four helix bundle protein [Saprospiraceae bacterium]